MHLTDYPLHTRIVAGLMSGTSVDAIDVAITRISQDGNRISVIPIAYQEFPWSEHDRQVILAISTESTTVQQVALVDRMIGDCFCSALHTLLSDVDMVPDAIGFHGQTVAHVPRPENGWLPSTLQLGNPNACSQAFKCPVVYDFRRGDMVSGGQGAPLVPAADSLMFSQHLARGPIAIQNIGGIGNITLLAQDRPPFGFDTGPGNMVLDQAMFIRTGHRFDKHGRLAESGSVNLLLLAELIGLFAPSGPPVSYGRETFGKEFMRQVLFHARQVDTPDLLATISEWTALTISACFEFFPTLPCRIFISGGGAHNIDLCHRIERTCRIPVHGLDALGIHGDAREAVAFAVLADARLRNVRFDLSQVTGSHGTVGLGSIALP